MRALLVVAALALVGCGHSPTAPDAPEERGLPDKGFTVLGGSPNEVAQVAPLWASTAACVGVDKRLGSVVYVTIKPMGEDFYCGTVLAAGCYHPPVSITVGREWYVPALQHEMIHLGLHLRGGDWENHQDPAFLRCDNAANFGSSGGRMIH